MNWFGWLKRKPKVHSGIVKKIELTFGGAGNQIMTIAGEKYATWVDYKKWPKIGQVVEFEIYFEHDGRDGILRCAKILESREPHKVHGLNLRQMWNAWCSK